AGTLSGTLASSESLKVYDGATLLEPATVACTSWSYITSTLSEAAHTLTARVEDSAGYKGAASSGFVVNVDTTAPTQTVTITSVTDDVSPVTGTLTSGDYTNDTQLALAGTLSATLASAETLKVYDGATL